ncbi:HNH endonuclease [Stenotrophomonas maltophilia]|uniref:HNH endonuclease n=1 Tax=Stenotrophomonas maltophilia TaxID=40324 RepID=UPI0009C08C2F
MESLLEQVKRALDYDPGTGVFTWLLAPAPWIGIGDVAGSLHKRTGYRYITVARKKYKAHRLAWFISTGCMPPVAIDHINGNRDDNRLSNLRLATYAQNQQNRGIDRRNTSGFPGVSWDAKLGKWRAKICVNRKQIHIGSFATPEEAGEAYRLAKQKHHTYNPMQRTEAP